MDPWVSRRQMLALSAAAFLAPEMLSCSTKSKAKKDDQDEDPSEHHGTGYDADAKEGVKVSAPKQSGQVGQKASVKAEWLPPVGNQHDVGNCFVWASAYGLATFNAARKSNKSPTSADLQAAPDYAYIQFEMSKKLATSTCNGGQVSAFLDWVKSTGGIPSLAAAPNYNTKEMNKDEDLACKTYWSKYGQTVAPDSRFIVDYKAIQLTGTDGLKNLRTVIAGGSPIAYGTHLHTDFHKYNGTPSPYVGSGDFIMKNGKKDGHALLIIGYDDTYGNNKGAVRIQNSWGTKWGDKGYVWMEYDTLQSLAEGTGCYAPESS